MPRLALLAPLPPETVTSNFPDIEVVTATDQTTAVEAARGAQLCVADWRGEVVVDEEVAAALAGTCRLVQVPAAGLNGIDLEACRRHDLRVASCGGLNTVAVAEWCIWAIIDALRGLTWSDRAMREGRWEMFGHARYELAGKVVGIVGLGDVGNAAAQRLRSFGVDLRYWSRRRRDADEEDRLGVAWSELDDLVVAVDVLLLAVALTPDTRHLLDAARLARMKPTAVVVNAARGEVWDEPAVATALRDGQLQGAATDVFSAEPPPDGHPLLELRTAVLTPHVAGTTAESVGRIIGRVFENIQAVLDDREPEGLVR